MNQLSNDDLFAVLRHLPPNDTTRFTRLNKQFGSLIAASPKHFSKPTIEIIIRDKTESVDTFTIVTAKGKITLLLPKHGNVDFTDSSLAREFLKPYFYRAWKNEIIHGKMKFKEFLQWLFLKVDLSAFNFSTFGPFTNRVIKSLVASNCRCPKIVFKSHLRSVSIEDEEQHLLTTFYTHQQNIGVMPRLWLNDVSTYHTFPKLEKCHSVFGEISVRFTSCRFFIYIFGLLCCWYHNNAYNVHVRFCLVEENIRLFKGTNFGQFLLDAMQIEVSSAEETFLEFLSYPTFDKFPKYFDFKVAEKHPKVLRVNFVVGEKSVLVKTEIVYNK